MLTVYILHGQNIISLYYICAKFKRNSRRNRWLTNADNEPTVVLYETKLKQLRQSPNGVLLRRYVLQVSAN